MSLKLKFGKSPELLFSNEFEFYRILGQIANSEYCTITFETNSDTGSYSDVYRIRINGNIDLLVDGMKSKLKTGNRINCHPYVQYLVSNFSLVLAEKKVICDYNKIITNKNFDKNFLNVFEDAYNEVSNSPKNRIKISTNHLYKVKHLSTQARDINYIQDSELIKDVTNLIVFEETPDYSPTPKPKKEAILQDEVKVYPRDRNVARRALARAYYRCEIQETHPSFISRNSHKQYVEPHHLIPISYQDYFDNSLDVEANIVSLCSNCHNEIHYGQDSESLIEQLYKKRGEELKNAGLDITLEQLLGLYKI